MVGGTGRLSREVAAVRFVGGSPKLTRDLVDAAKRTRQSAGHTSYGIRIAAVQHRGAKGAKKIAVPVTEDGQGNRDLFDRAAVERQDGG